jgi:hypothetical protein
MPTTCSPVTSTRDLLDIAPVDDVSDTFTSTSSKRLLHCSNVPRSCEPEFTLTVTNAPINACAIETNVGNGAEDVVAAAAAALIFN